MSGPPPPPYFPHFGYAQQSIYTLPSNILNAFRYTYDTEPTHLSTTYYNMTAGLAACSHTPCLPFFSSCTPPPPYQMMTPFQRPASTTSRPDVAYQKEDAEMIKIHFLHGKSKIANPDAIFSGKHRPSDLKYKPVSYPARNTIKQLFLRLKLDFNSTVLEEMVEEGGGYWGRGAKIDPFKMDGQTMVKDFGWRRGAGLSSAGSEPIWVVCRARTDDD